MPALDAETTRLVRAYLNASRAYARTRGYNRRQILRRRQEALWAEMTDEQRRIAAANWRDPS
jgi:hypothetical protein